MRNADSNFIWVGWSRCLYLNGNEAQFYLFLAIFWRSPQARNQSVYRKIPVWSTCYYRDNCSAKYGCEKRKILAGKLQSMSKYSSYFFFLYLRDLFFKSDSNQLQEVSLAFVLVEPRRNCTSHGTYGGAYHSVKSSGQQHTNGNTQVLNSLYAGRINPDWL